MTLRSNGFPHFQNGFPELDKEMLVSQHQLSNLETGCAISEEEIEKVS